MSAILRHSWLILLAFAGLSIAAAWQRLPAVASAGIISEDDGRRLLLRVLAFFAVLFGIQEGIVLAAGWPSPLCVHDRPFSDPFVVATWTVQAIASAWVLWWVWFGNGAATLGQLGTLFSGPADAGTPTPRTRVRLVVTLIIAGSALAGGLRLIGLRPELGPAPQCGVHVRTE